MRLLWFFKDEPHLEFRLPELMSWASLLKIDVQIDESGLEAFHAGDVPFLFADVPTEADGARLASKLTLLRAVYRCYGQGETYEAVRANCEPLEPEVAATPTFSVLVRAFGHKVTGKDHERVRGAFGWLFSPFPGKVDIESPATTFHIVLDYHHHHKRSIKGDETTPCMPGCKDGKHAPDVIYLTRLVSEGDFAFLHKYATATRGYLGTTTMDAHLAHLMAVQGKVRPGAFVLDPFVGTGGVLIAIAHMGGRTIGMDRDPRVFAREADKNIWTNHTDYGLPQPICLIGMDAAALAWAQPGKPLFDAIVCDPPYGIREGSKKIGLRRPELGPTKRANGLPFDENHFPQTVPYRIADLHADLFDHAVERLVLGGRLVYWHPCYPSTYTPTELPTHPALKLIANTLQVLSGARGRRLVTVEKIAEYDPDVRATPGTEMIVPDDVECPVLRP